jgi:hypothetical protein
MLKAALSSADDHERRKRQLDSERTFPARSTVTWLLLWSFRAAAASAPTPGWPIPLPQRTVDALHWARENRLDAAAITDYGNGREGPGVVVTPPGGLMAWRRPPAVDPPAQAGRGRRLERTV